MQWRLASGGLYMVDFFGVGKKDAVDDSFKTLQYLGVCKITSKEKGGKLCRTSCLL